MLSFLNIHNAIINLKRSQEVLFFPFNKQFLLTHLFERLHIYRLLPDMMYDVDSFVFISFLNEWNSILIKLQVILFAMTSGSASML